MSLLLSDNRLTTPAPTNGHRPAPRPSPGADAAFAVPFAHRLRFTDDVFGSDRAVLAELLEPSGEQLPRVQFWLDGHLTTARPDLVGRVRAFADEYAGRFRLAGEPRVLPGGEVVKNDWSILEGILAAVNDADLDRRSYMVVIGGGAVLDAVGFAAAISHRGIRLVRLPTTTLAQGDSGVGVKNGVNRFGKKNWLGAFAVPWAVVNDTALLATLPDRDFVAGFSETVKVSLLKSPAIFEQLCRDAGRVRRREPAAALPLIRASAELHLRHITQGGDPFEALEARPLDFGHWSAHKLEVMTDFGLRHGEAVAIGVAVDAVYSTLTQGFPQADAERVLQCLADLGLPLDHPAMRRTDELFAGMEEFRQHLGGRLTLTMLRRVGQAVDVHEVDRPAMESAFEQVAAFAAAVGR